MAAAVVSVPGLRGAPPRGRRCTRGDVGRKILIEEPLTLCMANAFAAMVATIGNRWGCQGNFEALALCSEKV